jgi:serine/threonine-protein kinase RsbW
MIREFVTSVGAQAGFAPADVGNIELAVDEACANVIEHAYGSDLTKEVSVRASFDEELLQIVVADTGRGFDPRTVQEKPLGELVAQRRSGGLGMQLIKKLMDEVHYDVVPGEKNEIRLVKRLHKSK